MRSFRDRRLDYQPRDRLPASQAPKGAIAARHPAKAKPLTNGEKETIRALMQPYGWATLYETYKAIGSCESRVKRLAEEGTFIRFAERGIDNVTYLELVKE